MPELKCLNYWERLQSLHLYSQERRMERYRAVYTWKILEGAVPNCGLTWIHHPKMGRMCVIPPLSKAGTGIQSIRDSLFQVTGLKIFNSLPRELRDKVGCSVTTWKNHLDLLLSDIPDQPILPGYVVVPSNMTTAKSSNSITDWLLYLRRDHLF